MDWSKLKAFADDKLNATEKSKFGLGWVESIVEQDRQIVARYARLTPSCKAGACTGQNSSMKTTKGTKSKLKQARVMIPVHCTSPL